MKTGPIDNSHWFTGGLGPGPRRSPVFARNGMVAASQPLATQAGLQTLQAGGTAADAAVATAAALGVTEPCSTGLGGDAFMLYYEAATGVVHALNGSGRAPTHLSLERLGSEGISADRPWSPFDARTITVPGACAAWMDTLDRFGELPGSVVLAPAIELATRGFPVAPLTGHFWKLGADRQLLRAPGGKQLLTFARAPRPGEIFRNPGLAGVLEAIASEGTRVFYSGWIAERIVETVAAAGGVLSEEDLAGHSSTWESAISTDYGGLRVWECPPNGQGLTALIALNILNQFEEFQSRWDPADDGAHPNAEARRHHLMIEALRLAFSDTRWYLTDPTRVSVPVAQLLSREYAGERARLIEPDGPAATVHRGHPVAGSDTVYLCAVDGAGNACSFINSNYMGFGTGIVPKGTGFSLQNRGHNFSLEPGHPNVVEGGKRPYHTIIPGMLTDAESGRLVGPFGVMGGFMQPQGHVQVVVGLVNRGDDPQTALDRPRFCIEDGTAGGGIGLEVGLGEELTADLGNRGHPVRIVGGHGRALFGRGQIILRDPESGVLCGGSDPRADGQAAGW